MPCRSSQRLTGQLVTKPSIIPICIRLDRVPKRRQPADLTPQRCDHEVLEEDPEDPGERQVEDVFGTELRCRADRPCGRPDDPLADDVPEHAAGAAVAVRERYLPQR